MNVEKQILEVLKGSRPELVIGDCRLEKVQENAYRLNSDGQSFFVKWIPETDQYGLNEIQVNETQFARMSILTPRFLFALRTAKAFIALWEWLDGTDLRTQNRDLLPDAFARLGHFHSDNRNSELVFSPTTRQGYQSLGEMLQVEIEYLSSFYPEPRHIQQSPLLPLLEQGYATLIHGDMHPGNIRLTRKGLQFVDWGYALNSLNLFDLDYIRSVALVGDEEWWIIKPIEAKTVLCTYFAHCGLGDLNTIQTHWAVMLWTTLRSLYHCIGNGDESGIVLCHQNVDLLLQRMA